MAYFILATAIIATVAAQLLVKRGVLDLEGFNLSPAWIFNLVLSIFHNTYLVSGLILFGVAFLLWVIVLSRIQLSIAYSLSTAINLALVTILSVLLFKEHLSDVQVLGLFITVIGVFLILWKT